jgi:hypothetical protein
VGSSPTLINNARSFWQFLLSYWRVEEDYDLKGSEGEDLGRAGLWWGMADENFCTRRRDPIVLGTGLGRLPGSIKVSRRFIRQLDRCAMSRSRGVFPPVSRNNLVNLLHSRRLTRRWSRTSLIDQPAGLLSIFLARLIFASLSMTLIQRSRQFQPPKLLRIFLPSTSTFSAPRAP